MSNNRMTKSSKPTSDDGDGLSTEAVGEERMGPLDEIKARYGEPLNSAGFCDQTAPLCHVATLSLITPQNSN